MTGLPRLDRYDVKLLATLQSQGRMTFQDLGDAIGLSTSPCLQRVKRLVAAGYIAGFGAWVELEKIRALTTVFTSVTLRAHTRGDFLRFEAGIRRHEELLECHLVSGGVDYLLKFVTRSIVHYQSIVEAILADEIGVDKYLSYIVIKSPVLQRFAPLSIATQEDPPPV